MIEKPPALVGRNNKRTIWYIVLNKENHIYLYISNNRNGQKKTGVFGNCFVLIKYLRISSVFIDTNEPGGVRVWCKLKKQKVTAEHLIYVCFYICQMCAHLRRGESNYFLYKKKTRPLAQCTGRRNQLKYNVSGLLGFDGNFCFTNFKFTIIGRILSDAYAMICFMFNAFCVFNYVLYSTLRTGSTVVVNQQNRYTSCSALPNKTVGVCYACRQ